MIAVNRRARFDYFILNTFECGIQLLGSEVKSIREGAVNLQEGYAHVRNGEVFLEGVHVRPYGYAHTSPPEPTRSRKLLLHRREIDHITEDLQQKRLTLVPLRMYLKKGRVKIEIGLGKGKKHHDKREAIKKQDAKRDLARSTRR